MLLLMVIMLVMHDDSAPTTRACARTAPNAIANDTNAAAMIGAGLDDGDLLIVDRSQNPEHNKIAVCFIDGEFTVKRLKVTAEGVFLIPENPKYDPIKVNEENHFQIWGIVTHVIKKV